MKLRAILLTIFILLLSLMLFSCKEENIGTQVTVIFDSNGGSAIEKQVIESGEFIDEPIPPKRDGYTFEGWFYEDKIWDFSGYLKKDITLVAKWSPIEYSITYINGTCSLLSYTSGNEYNLTEYISNAEQQYMEICGWYLDEELTKPFTKIEKDTFGDITLYAKLEYMPLTFNLSTDKEYTVTGCDANVTELIIPATYNGYPVKYIDGYAFSRHKNLTDVVIESGILAIRDYAFYDCNSLQSITIPNTVETVGNYSFALCKSLTEIELPGSVTSLGNGAFSGCSALTNAKLNNGITILNTRVFRDCDSLVAVDLGDSITVIESDAFYGCSSLVDIKYSQSLEAIGSYAFTGCTSLKGILITDKITKIESGTYSGCSSITEALISENITHIGSHAFKECTALKSIILGNNVSRVGDACFFGCTELSEVIIGYKTNLSIGHFAFKNCLGLKSIILPSNVNSLGSCVFEGCTGITINCEAKGCPTFWDGTWDNGVDCTINWGYVIEEKNTEEPDDNNIPVEEPNDDGPIKDLCLN